MMTNPVDPHEQNRRSQYLMKLAEIDGRDRPDHPQHGLFTGLYMDRVRLLINRDMDYLLGDGPALPPRAETYSGRASA